MKKLIGIILLTFVLIAATVTGCAGEQGLKGSKGDTGEQGTQGIQGEMGIQGEQGLQGVAGIKGATGAVGAKGETGIQGEQGLSGYGATGPQGPEGPKGLVGEIVATPNHGLASVFYQEASVAGSVVLGEGDWMIVASGAFNVTPGGHSLNVGLRIGEGETAIMLAKSNILSSTGCVTLNRVGFALVGAVSVGAGETLEVELVHRGGGDQPPFEYNIVAIGGEKP